jgi:tRNA pseudouridine38-40 synthase
MVRYRATLAYDGTAYVGWQIQSTGVPTIQDEVERALEQVLGTVTPTVAAGRTDAGVHATGQVIAFDAANWKYSAEVLLRALNANLPADIALQDLAPTRADFHPRFDATSRVYRYDVAETQIRQPLLHRRVWQVTPYLERAAMQQAASLLVGEHDFASFGAPTVGTVTIRWVILSVWTETPTEYGTLLSYHVEGNGFLRHMVRNIVGQLVAVGQGLVTLEEFEARFRNPKQRKSKRMAPPQGLCLTEVRYPTDEEWAELSARQAAREQQQLELDAASTAAPITDEFSDSVESREAE